MITPLDVIAARRRISGHLAPTPLRYSPWLSRAVGAQLYLKLESIQLTNSFKIRGAFNACLRLIAAARDRGKAAPAIVTASAGNHGRAMALVAQRLGLDLTVFTPRTAPETKKRAIRLHGVALRDEATDYDAAERAAVLHAREESALYISPYNHVDVIAGAGTVALEILDVLPILDVLVVPLGGGGLASGVGSVIKAAAPHVRIIGVEAAASTPFRVSLGAGAITKIDAGPSLADGLTGNLEPDSITFDFVRRAVDDVVSVEEDAIAGAICGLVRNEQLITEGAGAVAAAAALTRGVINQGEKAVVMVTGSNIDDARLLEVLGAATP